MQKNTESQALLATLLSSSLTLTALISQKEHASVFFSNPKQLYSSLLKFKKLLTTLHYKNVSHDPHYLEDLSNTWLILQKEGTPIRSRASKPSNTELSLKKLLLSFEGFPDGADHSLGYYLSRYGKDNWNPFPFMQHIEQLHQTETSSLQSWIALLEEILDDLQE